MTLRRALPWLIWLAALLVGSATAYIWLYPQKLQPQFDAVDITGVEWGKGFALTDHNGVPRSLTDFRGKVVMLTFGYTHCPDMCPTTLALLAGALEGMGADARDVQVLFVTVDPKRDTPQVLRQYVPAFHPSFLGLYGDAESTARTAREFKAHFELRPPNEHGGYTVDHSGQVYVFDAQGRLRLFIRPEASPDSIVRDVRTLLTESGL
jgi:protein SCO1/2